MRFFNKKASKLDQIVSLCKCEVIITINDHTVNYQSTKESLRDLKSINPPSYEDIPKKVIEKIIELNTIVNVYAYPDTPIGSYHVVHYDIDKALNQMLKILKS